MSAVHHNPAAPKVPAVETLNLEKTYRTGFWLNQKVLSLKPCNLTVYQGETFGLLGPNGAGKTTLLKTLLGIVRPTRGRGALWGEPIGTQTVKQRLGYLPENPYFYDYLTGWEYLEFTAGLFQIPRPRRRQRIPELLALVGLTEKTAQKKQLRQYSKGMLQRLGMAQALINDPDLLFLDEPMSGLDPLGRYQMREIILALKQQGKTIFFNSHILSDVEMICDRVALLVQGELVCVGSLGELLGPDNSYRVRGQGGDPKLLEQWLTNFKIQGNSWSGLLQGLPGEFLLHLQNTSAQIWDLHQARPSLEEFFLQQVQKQVVVTDR